MSDRRRWWRRIPPEVVAAVLLLVVPFWSFLHLHSYNLFRPGALLVAGVLAAAGVAYGWLMHRTRSSLLRVILLTGLLLVSVDLIFDIDGHHLAVLAILFGLTWILRTHAARIVTVMLLAYGVSTLGFGAHVGKRVSGTGAVTAPGNRPPLLHLIADEHVGIEGIPTEVEGAKAIKDSLIAFYVNHGFRLFTRAYAQYSITLDVIPNELNFAERSVGFSWVGGPDVPRPVPLTQNQYFERLAQAGYGIRVYQPDFIDFCAAISTPPTFCYTVPTNSLIHLPELNLDWSANAWFIAAYWVTNNSSLYSRAYQRYEGRLRPALRARKIAAPHWPRTNRKLGPASAMDLLQRISNDIETLPTLDGTAFFTHVLLPHYPYLFDERCLSTQDPLAGLDPQENTLELTEIQRHTKFVHYLPQVRCLTRRIDELLSGLESRGAGDAVVIVQGDHGSRVGSKPSIGGAIPRQKFADYYSTLFAIRAPGITPGVDTTLVSVKDLLNRFSAAGFTDVSDLANANPYVFLSPGYSNTRRVPAPVPIFWKDSNR